MYRGVISSVKSEYLMQKASIREKKQKSKHTHCCCFESCWKYECHQESRLAVALNYGLPVAWNEPLASFYLLSQERKRNQSPSSSMRRKIMFDSGPEWKKSAKPQRRSK